MPDQLQLRGGTTTEHNSFTGALREVTVDTTKKTLVVHDGSQAGGTPLMKESGATAASSVQIGTGGVERFKITSSEVVFNETSTDTDFRIEGNTDTNLFRLDASTDRIGIGVSTPQQKLHIGASDSGSVNMVFTNATTGSTTSDGFIVGITGGEDAQLNMQENANLKFGTNDTERMRIDSSGRVIIGATSTSPANSYSDNLVVSEAGNVGMQFVGNNSNSNYVSIYLGDAGAAQRAFLEAQLGANGLFTIGASGTGAMRFNNNGSERMRIDSSGRLLLGTTTEGAANADEFTISTSAATGMTIRSGSSHGGSLFFSDATSGTGEYAGYVQYDHGTDYLAIGTSAQERMRIDSSGKVGLGTTSPLTSLHVKHATDNGVALFESGDASGGIALKDNSTTNNVFLLAQSDDFKVLTGGSERVRINSSGNVGIGTSSPDTLLHLAGGSPNIKLNNTGTSANANDVLGKIIFQHADTDDAGITAIIQCVAEDNAGNSFLAFHNGDGGNADERMRLNSTGFLQYNNTSNIGGVFQLTADGVTNLSANKLARFNYNATGDVVAIEMRHARGGLSGFNGKMISFTGNDGTEEGSINIHTTSVAYNTSSDYRLKENEVAISDGITKLKQLKPYRFNFKKDPDVKVDGFFAHEVASVVPIAVTGEKDAMEAETRYEEGDTIPEGKVIGDPKTFSTTKISPQQLDHSKLVPLLVAAVQELIGKVEALEAA